MLKAGDIVYRVNLKEISVDQLMVKQIIHYEEDESFEFELTSFDYWCKSKGCYEYKAWQQIEAENIMKSESLIFNSLEEATTYINKEIERVLEELESFQQLYCQCLELKWGTNIPG